MADRSRSRKRGGAAHRVSQPKRRRPDRGDGEDPEPLQLAPSSSMTDKTQPSLHGNQIQNRESPPANFVDFEKLLLESDIPLPTTSSDASPTTSHNHTQISQPLSATAHTSETTGTVVDFNNFNSREEMLRLVAEDMTSHVPAQLCEKIWSHQYINIALLLKGNVELQDLCSGGILHITDKGQLETRPKNTKDKVTTIEKWTDSFLIFSSIYLKRYPDKIQELLQYMIIIRDAASRSTSTFSRRTYDEQFRLRQATSVQPWGKLNSDLWLRVMTSSTSQSDQPTQPKGTCFDFNNGFCAWNNCRYTHACSHCGGTTHGRQTCFRLHNQNITGRGMVPSFRRFRRFPSSARGGRPFQRPGNKQ